MQQHNHHNHLNLRKRIQLLCKQSEDQKQQVKISQSKIQVNLPSENKVQAIEKRQLHNLSLKFTKPFKLKKRSL